MILARLTLNNSRRARLWVGNPYRVHQRLTMACEGDPRVLFRIEEQATNGCTPTARILVQATEPPQWQRAFRDFPVLARSVEVKAFEPTPRAGAVYRFRLMANPTVCRNGQRHGLRREEEQHAWLERKLLLAGAELVGTRVQKLGTQRSSKGDGALQHHLAVRFDGAVRCIDPDALAYAVRFGIGRGKGFGFGLLSLAAVRSMD